MKLRPHLKIDVLIDDLGLTPSEMRVFIAVARRACGPKGICYESTANLASRTNLSKSTVIRCLKTLVVFHILTPYIKPGTTTTYAVNDSSQWLSKLSTTDLSQTLVKSDPCHMREGGGVIPTGGGCVISDTGGVSSEVHKVDQVSKTFKVKHSKKGETYFFNKEKIPLHDKLLWVLGAIGLKGKLLETIAAAYEFWDQPIPKQRYEKHRHQINHDFQIEIVDEQGVPQLLHNGAILNIEQALDQIEGIETHVNGLASILSAY